MRDRRDDGKRGRRSRREDERDMQMDVNTARQELTPEHEFAYGQKSMNWYGFGSPVGLGILLVSVGLCALLVRIAVMGF
jgi:hypothetical protein